MGPPRTTKGDSVSTDAIVGLIFAACLVVMGGIAWVVDRCDRRRTRRAWATRDELLPRTEPQFLNAEGVYAAIDRELLAVGARLARARIALEANGECCRDLQAGPFEAAALAAKKLEGEIEVLEEVRARLLKIYRRTTL